MNAYERYEEAGIFREGKFFIGEDVVLFIAYLAKEFDELDDSFLEGFVADVDAELWLPHNRVAGCAARLWVGAADESNALCWPLAY